MNNILTSLKLILQISLFVLYLDLKAQDAAKDLSKVSLAYLKADQLAMNIDVFLYASAKSSARESLGTAVMRKEQEKYYSKFMMNEMISDGEHTLIVDHDDKTLNLFKQLPASMNTNPGNINMDSILLESDSVLYGGLDKGIKMYTIYQSNNVVKRTDIYINVQSSLVERLIYLYVESSEGAELGMEKVEIIYKKVDKKIDPGYFNISKYLVKEENGFILQREYKDYDLSINI